MMRLRLLAVIALASCVAALAGCPDTGTGNTDFGVVLPGCRLPFACYDVHCTCNFSTFDACKVCDPATAPNNLCDCGGLLDGGITALCQEAAQVCVGRAATTCDGRCVHAGSTCDSDPIGQPPEEVSSTTGVDGGPSLERRCAFADDLCCPNQSGG